MTRAQTICARLHPKPTRIHAQPAGPGGNPKPAAEFVPVAHGMTCPGPHTHTNAVHARDEYNAKRILANARPHPIPRLYPRAACPCRRRPESRRRIRPGGPRQLKARLGPYTQTADMEAMQMRPIPCEKNVDASAQPASALHSRLYPHAARPCRSRAGGEHKSRDTTSVCRVNQACFPRQDTTVSLSSKRIHNTYAVVCVGCPHTPVPLGQKAG